MTTLETILSSAVIVLLFLFSMSITMLALFMAAHARLKKDLQSFVDKATAESLAREAELYKMKAEVDEYHQAREILREYAKAYTESIESGVVTKPTSRNDIN